MSVIHLASEVQKVSVQLGSVLILVVVVLNVAHLLSVVRRPEALMGRRLFSTALRWDKLIWRRSGLTSLAHLLPLISRMPASPRNCSGLILLFHFLELSLDLFFLSGLPFSLLLLLSFLLLFVPSDLLC